MGFWEELERLVGGKRGEQGFDVIPSPWGPTQETAAGMFQDFLTSGDWRQKQQPVRGLGLLKPSMTPDMRAWAEMTRAYSASPAPYIMGQAAGTLGQFMKPDLTFDPNQRLEGMFEGRDLTDLFAPPQYGG